MAPREVLTSLAKVKNEAPLYVGAAYQILCCLDGVNGLGAHLALFGAQPLTFVAEYASRGKQRVRHETRTSSPQHPQGAPTCTELTCCYYG